jgi:hypothetical protein
MNSYYLLSVGIELGKSVEQAGPSLTFNPEGACRWLFCHIREAWEPLARYFLLKPSFLYRPKKPWSGKSPAPPICTTFCKLFARLLPHSWHTTFRYYKINITQVWPLPHHMVQWNNLKEYQSCFIKWPCKRNKERIVASYLQYLYNS